MTRFSFEGTRPGGLLPLASDDAEHHVEFEVTYRITRSSTREAAWAAQPHSTVFSDTDGGIEPIRDGLEEQPAPPLRHLPVLERPFNTTGGEIIHGCIRAPISAWAHTTWLTFTPPSEVPAEDAAWLVDHSWNIEGGPEQ